MKPEVLVIGGGPAGTAAAIRLAESGAVVTLLERDRAPAHKVCGEFLSGEALAYLELLGIDLRSIGAVALRRVRFGENGSSRPLPFPAMSLTRRRLDQALLDRAEAAGVRVRRGCRVEQLLRVGNAWQVSLPDKEEISSSTVFLACGKHDLRGHARPAGRQAGMIAFKMYWRLSPQESRSLGPTVELFTFGGGYAGLQPVEDGLVNLCCLVRGVRLRRLGGWGHLLAHMCAESPLLRQRLVHAKPQLSTPLSIASLPYGFIRQNADNLWYLGDQAAVIPSFTGDGVSLALHTGSLAASMYLCGESASSYQQTVAGQVGLQVKLATIISKVLVSAPHLPLLASRIWPSLLDLIAWQTRIDSTSQNSILTPPESPPC